MFSFSFTRRKALTRTNQALGNFMVLSTARTGSNLLMYLLGSHPRIKMQGELFNLDSLKRDDLHEVLTAPVDYLYTRFSKWDHHLYTVGFKFFYDHLSSEYFEKVINTAGAAKPLQEMNSSFKDHFNQNYDRGAAFQKFDELRSQLVIDHTLRVIHLRRLNKLDTLISLKTAFLTNEWIKFNGSNQLTAITLEVDECVKYFESIENHERHHDILFKDHSLINVEYETLVKNKNKEMTKVFEFLGVENQEVVSRIRKQSNFKKAETLRNYYQLKEHFQNTSWANFFDE